MKTRQFFPFFAGILALVSIGHANVIYDSTEDRSPEEAALFSQPDLTPGRYLIFRDFYSLLNLHNVGVKTLDYGTGAGYCIPFLNGYKLDVTGVDISQEMLKKAEQNYPTIPFHLIQKGELPFENNVFDLVFSSFVLLEMGTEKEIVAYLEAAKRVMKDDGTFIAITSSEERYSRDWLDEEVDFPENKNLKSGGKIRLYLKTLGIEFIDYYWTESDYRSFFEKAGFQIAEIYYPLGLKNEPYPWKDELYYSPYMILVAKKSP